MKVSISLGGSLLTKNQDSQSFIRYAEVIRRLKNEGHIIIVVCGGGRPARQCINLSKELGAAPKIQDEIGILTTHINALLLIAALGKDADQRIHRRGIDVKNHLGKLVLVGGGYKPGSSTDYRSALFAGAIDAELIINATDFPGVFDKDPTKFPDAKKFDSLNYKQLEEIVKSRFKQSPGDYGLFDLKAVKYVASKHIPVIIIDGTDPEEIVRAIKGNHCGTIISD
jgi:uridylate kinase